MTSMDTMIKCLPAEIQGKLRSGVAMPSLQQCVEELILNSIDAEATCVGVRMDMEALKVQVIDNGSGINAEDMQNLGKRYYTSKCSAIEDLDNLRWYGFRGEALASVVSLATLVEISSRTRLSVKTHTKLFKDGKGMEVFEAETSRPSAGTTVVICSFFHNMPVRRKRMDAVLEGERIRHRVETISLMHPAVSFTLKNDCTGAMTVQLPKAKNTYHRFVQMHGLGRAQKLGEISYTHGQFEVIGYIGREGHYNNSLQYLYVNDRLLLKTRLHKLLNFLLRRLSSSSKKNDSPAGQSAIRSPKHKRSQEQHGVYIINIKCSYSEYDICLEPAKTLIEFRDWDGILLCMEQAVKAFLSKENLVAELSPDDVDYLSPKLFGTHTLDQEGQKSSNGGQNTSNTSTLDCSIGIKLVSESVHRKHKDESVSEDTVGQESGTMEGKEETEQIGQQRVTANGLEREKGEGNKECRGDLDIMEPASYGNITEEEELTSSEAGEDPQNVCMSNQIRQPESEICGREIQLNHTTSVNNVTLQHSITQQIQPDVNRIEQILPDCQFKGQSIQSNKKISVSDPYIHESLQTQGSSKNCTLLFQQKSLKRKCEARVFVSKHKISLDADNDKSCLKQCKDFVPIIPSKIPRIVSSHKFSLCKESGSLETFRRKYCKSAEPKLPSAETQQENSARPPETNSDAPNSENLIVCQKDQQDGGIIGKEKEETGCPSALSVFTKLKPVSGEKKTKKTLATKLCQLKQHRRDNSNASPKLSRTASQDNNGGTEDRNNNENPWCHALDPEPGCSTNPLLAEKEKATTSGDWLHHYDTSVGKMVYVNKVTGLSRYKDPHTEETQVRCTSDVTNMAVSVISKMGMEHRCYPFQVDLVLPFLPKSRRERLISSGFDERGTSQTD
ncbi:DNA mismatch repair protein Mlh3 [Tautogolabrus adspersus]